MDFNLDRLRTFIVVARAKNLSAAARELGATQPNVGRQMAALEKEVNLVLFSRHSRGLDLTKQGQEFLELCQDIVGRLAQGTDVIRERDSEPEGKFNFVSGAGLLEAILENIALFSEKFPKISFNFSSIPNIYQLQIGGADAAVMVEAVSDADFIQRPLYNNPVRIYASPRYLQSHPIPKTLKDLQSHKVIIYAGEKQEIMNQQIMQDNTVNFLQPFIELASGPIMRKALINGAGIGCCGYDRNIMEKGLLVDVFPDMPDQIMSYYYTYHKRLEGSPKIEAFYEFLKDITKVWERL
ncbi:MAG: Bacterial regulatory helix-turn-helix protein lysR family,ligand-binding protein LysR family [Alphaproteobacteria bacterium]|jgi:DNA-binding transcriptional LysR family regulator|nr:Bacterial regulatory helix-turn-helix protein lysR family,ligand-binding protein LysR family [Alphaproteobacteria bacterium]